MEDNKSEDSKPIGTTDFRADHFSMGIKGDTNPTVLVRRQGIKRQPVKGSETYLWFWTCVNNNHSYRKLKKFLNNSLVDHPFYSNFGAKLMKR